MSLSLLTGHDIGRMYKMQLIGITEAERIVVAAFKNNAPKGKVRQAAVDAKRAMADLTTKTPAKKVNIVPVSDPRPAINRLEQTFGGVALPAPSYDEIDVDESED